MNTIMRETSYQQVLSSMYNELYDLWFPRESTLHMENMAKPYSSTQSAEVICAKSNYIIKWLLFSQVTTQMNMSLGTSFVLYICANTLAVNASFNKIKIKEIKKEKTTMDFIRQHLWSGEK